MAQFTHKFEFPAFSGLPGEDFTTWLGRMNAIADVLEVAGRQRAALLIANLKGPALQLVIHAEEENRNDPAALTNFLKSTFVPQNEPFILQRELDRLSQEPNEPVMAFATKLKTLTKRLNLSDEQQTRAFISKVKKNIQTYILTTITQMELQYQRNPDKDEDGHDAPFQRPTFEETLQMALGFEGALSNPENNTPKVNSLSHRQYSHQKHQRRYQPSQNQQIQGNQRPTQNQDSQQGSNKNSRHQQNKFRKYTDFYTTNGIVVCGFCRRMGHSFRNCFKRQQSHANTLEPFQENTEQPSEQQTNTIGKEEYHVNILSGNQPTLIEHVKIGETTIPFTLIDSGASISILDSRLAKEFNTELQPSNTRIFDANNGDLKVVGKSNFNILIDKKSILHDCFIVENFKYPLLLGLDALEKFNAKVDFGKRKLTIPGCHSHPTNEKIFFTKTLTFFRATRAPLELQRFPL